MPNKRQTIWPIERHTEAKHEILRHYLDAWLPIITRYHGRAVYIDGFAGPGVYAGGEPGSPIVALRAALEHTHPIRQELVYWFIEEDQARQQNLEQEIAKLGPLPPNIDYRIDAGKFDATLARELDEIEQRGKRLAPTFAFVDPFGWSQTPMSLLKRLLANPHCEVFVTLIYEELNRFLGVSLPNDARDDLFGTTAWRDIILLQDPAGRRARLHDLYQGQLKQCAGARFVRSFEMRNKTNGTDLYLFFATNSAQGLEKMKDAMWRVSPTGAYRFSDATNRDQPVLFDLGPDYAALRALIEQRLVGRAVSVREVHDFVVQETPFRGSHYKTQVLRAMERETPVGLQIVAAPPGRKRGTFPEGTRVRFC